MYSTPGSASRGRCSDRHDPLPEPDPDRLDRKLAAQRRDDEVLDLAVARGKPVRVEPEEELGRGGARALVPVPERVLLEEGLEERRRLPGKVGIQILASEAHCRAGGGGLECPAIAKTRRPAEAFDLPVVDVPDLVRREVTDHVASFR